MRVPTTLHNEPVQRDSVHQKLHDGMIYQAGKYDGIAEVVREFATVYKSTIYMWKLEICVHGGRNHIL